MFLLHVHTCSNVQPNYNKTATGALRDVVPRLCQGVLCFQYGMRFHGTCVLRFTGTRNVRPFLSRFSRSSKTYRNTVTRNVSHIGQRESKFIYAFKDDCHIRFSRNSHLLDKCLQRTPIPHFMKIRQRVGH